MGVWRWLFARKGPDLEEDGNRLIEVGEHDGKRHGPYKRYRKDGSLLEEGTYVAGERDGPFVIHGREVRVEGTYLAGKLHGLHRVLGLEGSIREEREYDHGEVVRGPHELRDAHHSEWIRERGTLVHGKRDGVWREYGIPRRDGKSPLMKRCHYKVGVLDGAYETWFYDGTRAIEGEYRDGARVGRWTFWRHDGSTQAEVDYEGGAIAHWRWLACDGGERALVRIDDEDDLERWLALGDAWDEIDARGTYGTQLAIDRWPADRRARPLAWIDERVREVGKPPHFAAAGAWLDAMLDSDEPDPRTRYVDVIELDNHDWDEDQTRRLQRFAPQILELGLVECGARPAIGALFDVAWPKLTVLALHECGPVDDVIAKVHASPIEHLALTYEPLAASAIRELVAAPWFARLQSLRLTVEDRTIVDALAARGMPELRELELESYDLELTAGDIATLIDREQRPTLATLRLDGITIEGELPSRAGLEIERR